MSDLIDKIWAAIQRPSPSVTREEIEASQKSRLHYCGHDENGIPNSMPYLQFCTRNVKKLEALED